MTKTPPNTPSKIFASDLPETLQNAYRNWYETDYTARKDDFFQLVTGGQTPDAMVISCCDSRVNITHIFGTSAGGLFIHRNIANFVPAAQASPDNHGTAAAMEYAVKVLEVARIIVVGHALCGGVRACMDVCAGEGADIEKDMTFIARWVDLLKPAYERLGLSGNPHERLHDMERENVKHSLENLLSYDFIADAVGAQKLDIHGLWYDLRDGVMHSYNPEKNGFEKI